MTTNRGVANARYRHNMADDSREYTTNNLLGIWDRGRSRGRVMACMHARGDVVTRGDGG